MSSQPPRPAAHWILVIVGLAIAVLGLILAIGGVRLLMLGGSWYYALAGPTMMFAGVWIMRGRMIGVRLYGALLVATTLWTLAEVGPDFWGFVPRVALLLLVGLILSLLLSKFDRPPRYTLTRAIPIALAIAFLSGVAWAFVPHHAFRSGAALPQLRAAAPRAMQAGSPETQPASTPASGDWAAYGRSNAGTRYSPLRQINRDNVRHLQRVWVYRTGDMPRQGERNWGAATTPLKIGDTVYLCSGTNKLVALDAATGKERWFYDPEVSYEHIPHTATCRGVAYYEAPQLKPDALCQQRIIEGTLDARLIAVDAATGQPCTGFGNNGEVNLLLGMGKIYPATVGVTSPPTIVRGIAIVGHQVLDGQYHNAPSGVIRGYNAVSGELVWAWDMLRPNSKGLPTEMDEYSRGTPNSWAVAAGDEALGLVYVPMGNSSADYYSGSRTDIEKRYSTAVVALDVSTGDVRWSFQTVHIDVWNYDLGSQPTLLDLQMGGVMRRALILPTRQGDIYLLDRESGDPLLMVEEHSAPRGKTPGNVLSPTQPHSIAMPALRQPDLREQDMWGISPIDQLYCRIRFREAVYEGLYTAPTLQQYWVQWPGSHGGNNWGSTAVDGERGLLVANYNNVPMYNRLMSRAQADAMGLAAVGMRGGSSKSHGLQPMIGTPYGAFISPWRVPYTGLLCNDPPYGSIAAIDLQTRKVLWDVPLGTARRNGPFGIATHLPIHIGTPNDGGPIVTAGGLIFIAAATDNLIRAIDIATGEVVWSDELPAGGQATPITYEVKGDQYLVMMAGGHHLMQTPAGDYVIAWKLISE